MEVRNNKQATARGSWFYFFFSFWWYMQEVVVIPSRFHSRCPTQSYSGVYITTRNTCIKDGMTYTHERTLTQRHAEYTNTMCRCTRVQQIQISRGERVLCPKRAVPSQHQDKIVCRTFLWGQYKCWRWTKSSRGESILWLKWAVPSQNHDKTVCTAF